MFPTKDWVRRSGSNARSRSSRRGGFRALWGPESDGHGCRKISIFEASSTPACARVVIRHQSPLLCQKFRLRPQRLVESLHQLAPLRPLNSLPAIARYERLTLGAFWPGCLCPGLPSLDHLELPLSLLRCPFACRHRYFQLIVWLAAVLEFPRARDCC